MWRTNPIMMLQDWLDRTNTTASALAREVGCSHTTIIRIARGEIEPRPAMRRRIVEATAGQVAEVELVKLGSAAGSADLSADPRRHAA